MVRKPLPTSEYAALVNRFLDLAASLREIEAKSEANSIASMDVHSNLLYLGLDHAENAVLGIQRDLAKELQRKNRTKPASRKNKKK